MCNEEENISVLIKRLQDSLTLEHELVIVNDHSTDNTGQLLEQAAKCYGNIVVVKNNLKKGFANALKCGFCRSSADIIIPVMGDLCDDPSTIETMLAKINEGYDIVCGSRYIKGGARTGGSRIKGFFSYFVGITLHRFVGIPTHDSANAFKMYRKKVIDRIDICSKNFEVSLEIILKAYYEGFKITEVPTLWHERNRGRSSFSMFKLLPEYLKIYLWAISKSMRI